MFQLFAFRFSAISLVLFLAACAETGPETFVSLEPSGMRSGVGSEMNFATVKPPTGTRVTYEFAPGSFPLPTTGVTRIRKSGDNQYLHAGNLVQRISDPSSRKFVEALLKRNPSSAAKLQGNRMLLPVTALTDARNRTIRSSFGGSEVAYAPHDCFATLGECRTTKVSPGKGRENLKVVTTQEGGFWRERTYLVQPGPDKVVSDSLYSIDRNALIIDMKWVNYESSTPRIQALRRRY